MNRCFLMSTILLAACGQDSSSPRIQPLLSIVAGDGQVDTVGKTLPVQLGAQLTDASSGAPLPVRVLNWVAVDGGDRHWARRGDVIVLPYGDQHCMGGVRDADVVSISTILQMPPWRQMPVIRHGADGELTDVVCGYLHSQDPLFDPGLRVFSPVLVVRPPDGPAADWVRANVAYALEQTELTPPDPGIVMSRLPELLLVEVLRLHLASAPAADRGWLAALNDPVLRPAMSLLHGAPGRRWTVSALAREAAVSRSVLDGRFREVLGRSPIRYLTEWRMHEQ